MMNSPDDTTAASRTKFVRVKSQPRLWLNILAMTLVPPMELPVRKISPAPMPMKNPAKIADTSGSPNDSALPSVM